MINATDINPASGKAYAINPQSNIWDDNYFDKTYGAQNRAETAADPINQAQRALDFQKTANAPVVASLQTQTPGIQDKYKQLVDSIKGNQQVDQNRQTLATNNQLGARGILPSSGVYQQEQVNAQLPINAAYSGQLAQANTGSIQDLQQLALQIAQLQAGNPESAMSTGLQLGGLQQSQNQFTQNLALQQAQLAQQAPLVGAQTTYQKALANSLGGGNISGLDQLRTMLGG